MSPFAAPCLPVGLLRAAATAPLTQSTGDRTAQAAADQLPEGARAEIYRQSFVAKILHDVWARHKDRIVETSDAHQREREMRDNDLYAHRQQHREARGAAPGGFPGGFGGLGSRAIPRTRPVPEALRAEQRLLWRRFAERARQYMARVDAEWRARAGRRAERISRVDIFGHSAHRAAWDEAAKQAAEAYIVSFYGERVAHHQFWQMRPEERVPVPDRFRVVKKAPFVVEQPTKRPRITLYGASSGSDSKRRRGEE